MVQATGTGVGFWEGVLAAVAVIALWRAGSGIHDLADAAGIVAREARKLRELAEELDDE
jgi:hypothetical protein